ANRCMKSVPYTGPEPTLGSLHSQFGWVWACCGVTCSHYAAIPLKPIVALLGADAPANALRSRLRCTKCGSRKAGIKLPSAVGHGSAQLPPDCMPLALRRVIAKD